MPQYVDVKGVSDSGKRFIEYTLAAGFGFLCFVEEPKYASYLTSHPRGVSARYHFVEMITEGGHGISRPMTTGEIIKAHPELTPSQVNELRDFITQTKTEDHSKSYLSQPFHQLSHKSYLVVAPFQVISFCIFQQHDHSKHLSQKLPSVRVQDNVEML